jgi:hypothetical protein
MKMIHKNKCVDDIVCWMVMSAMEKRQRGQRLFRFMAAMKFELRNSH